MAFIHCRDKAFPGSNTESPQETIEVYLTRHNRTLHLHSTIAENETLTPKSGDSNGASAIEDLPRFQPSSAPNF